MKPDARHHNPDPLYLRDLVQRADLSQERAAAALGISPRQIRYYLSTASDHQDAPYAIQFALECLAGEDPPAVRLMGLMVKAAGGELRVRRQVIEEISPRDVLEREDDRATGDVVFRIRRQPERRARKD